MHIIDSPVPMPTRPAEPLPVRRIEPTKPKTTPIRPIEVPAPDRKAA